MVMMQKVALLRRELGAREISFSLLFFYGFTLIALKK
jgi:hypothetical protein